MFESLKTIHKNAYAKRGITCDEQVVRFYPRKYKDYRNPAVLKKERFSETGLDLAVPGVIDTVKESEKNGRKITTVKAVDREGTTFSVIFMNMRNIAGWMASMAGQELLFMGVFKYSGIFGYSVFNPVWTTHVREHLIVQPKYSKIRGMADDRAQDNLDACLFKGEIDTIPLRLVHGYPGINQALRMIHHPADPGEPALGMSRMILDDLVYMKAELAESDIRQKSTIIFAKRDEMDQMLEKLPYSLTGDQRQTIDSVLKSAGAGKAVQALVQGDVGCGKTIIAFALMKCAAENGYQSVLMAPTQILAQQHYQELQKLVPPEQIAFLDGTVKAAQKKKLITAIRNGSAFYIVGTSALLSVKEYKNLGLVITDEEHRFGVKQRDSIFQPGIHRITMSATPIPRTLAGAIYGESTDIYQIVEKPAGRKPVVTYYDDGKKADGFLYGQLKTGTQAYVVCPLKEESDDDSPVTELDSVQEAFADYKKKFEPLGYHVEMVTGETPAEEKSEIFKRFQDGKTAILVSTTVIEVGVNVPNANVIVIRNAERFGLATLHQLRGRVGRGNAQGYCVLVSNDNENERLRVMCSTNDGFQVAEADLKERRSGDLMGVKQSGKNRFVEELIAYPMIANDAKKIVAAMTPQEREEHMKKYEKIYPQEPDASAK